MKTVQNPAGTPYRFIVNQYLFIYKILSIYIIDAILLWSTSMISAIDKIIKISWDLTATVSLNLFLKYIFHNKG